MLKPIGNMCLVIAFVAGLTWRLDDQSVATYASEHGVGPALDRFWNGPKAASAPAPSLAPSPVDLLSDIQPLIQQAEQPSQVAHIEEREEIVEDAHQSQITTVNKAQLTNEDFDELSGRLEPASTVYLCTFTKCLIDNDDTEPDD